MSDPAPIGDNSVMSKPGAEQLRAFADRIKNLLEDRAIVDADIKEVYGEVKEAGFATKTLKAALKRITQDEAKRKEEEDLIDLYMTAIQGELF